jgi:hypothetical protein
LTSASWSDFSKWVREEHPGWSVKRREATEAEKRQHGETRQSKCYWVDATYKPSENKKRPAVRYDNSISDSDNRIQSAKRSKFTHPQNEVVHDNLVKSNVDENAHNNNDNVYDEDTDDSILVSGLEPLLDYDDDEEEESNEVTACVVVTSTCTTSTTAPQEPVTSNPPQVEVGTTSSHVNTSATAAVAAVSNTCTPSPSGSPTPFVTPGSTVSSSSPPPPPTPCSTTASPPPIHHPATPAAVPVASNTNQLSTPAPLSTSSSSSYPHTSAPPPFSSSSSACSQSSMATPCSIPPSTPQHQMCHTPLAPTSVVPGTLIRLHVVRADTSVPLGINIYAPQDPASVAAARVAIASVSTESTADRAGLCVGDVLVTMHGQLVSTTPGPAGLDNAVSLFRSLPPSFEVTVLR